MCGRFPHVRKVICAMCGRFPWANALRGYHSHPLSMSFAETNATYSANHFRGHQESATYSAYQVAQARTPPSRARASIVGMDSLAPLAHRMPYTAAFPKALGTGLLISTPRPIALELCAEIGRFIDEYEHVLSRFRAGRAPEAPQGCSRRRCGTATDRRRSRRRL